MKQGDYKMKIIHLSDFAIQIIDKNNFTTAYLNNAFDRERLQEILPQEDFGALIEKWGEPNPELEFKPEPPAETEDFSTEPFMSELDILTLAVSELAASIKKSATTNKPMPNVEKLMASAETLTEKLSKIR